MLVILHQYVKFVFASMTEKLTLLFGSNVESERAHEPVSESVVLLSRDFLRILVWLRKTEDPRLDPSLGGRDPTGNLVYLKPTI